MIYYGDKSKSVDFDKTEAKYETIYGAHYNECEHEMQPLKAGYRSVLVFYLVWKCQDAPPPNLQANDERIEKLASLLNKVVNECKQKMQPLKSGYRSVLVYHLIWKCQDALIPTLQANDQRIEKLASLLNKVLYELN